MNIEANTFHFSKLRDNKLLIINIPHKGTIIDYRLIHSELLLFIGVDYTL